MEILKILIVLIIFIVLIFLFFFVCSKVENFKTGFCVLLLVALSVCGSFLVISKKNVIQLNGDDLEIINISYYCPSCGNYIPGINTQFCSRCGRNLQNIKKQINNFNNIELFFLDHKTR